MMNGVSNYGMSMNSQVNFQRKSHMKRKTLQELKIYQNAVKKKNFEKELNTKVDEIMSKLKEGQITYSEALDAAMNLERSAQMQIKKFEAFV